MGKTIIVKRRDDNLPNILCDDNIGQIVRYNILKELNRWDVMNLCLVSKKCNKNIGQNKNLWKGMLYQKFGYQIEYNDKLIDRYYGRTLYIKPWDEEEILEKINVYDFAVTDLFIGILDFDKNFHICCQVSSINVEISDFGQYVPRVQKIKSMHNHFYIQTDNNLLILKYINGKFNNIASFDCVNFGLLQKVRQGIVIIIL